MDLKKCGVYCPISTELTVLVREEEQLTLQCRNIGARDNLGSYLCNETGESCRSASLLLHRIYS